MKSPKNDGLVNIFGGFAAVWVLMSSKKSLNIDIMRTSYLGTQNERGIRNNNPLNIKYSNREYFGKIPLERNTDKDKEHEQFESLVYGIAAAIQHMTARYITQVGWTVQDCSVPKRSMTSPFDTVRKIANVWAPLGCDKSATLPLGNQPDEYIAFVVRKTGINADVKLSATDKDTLKKLIWAMSLFENGTKYEANGILSWSNWEMFFNVAWSIVNP